MIRCRGGSCSFGGEKSIELCLDWPTETLQHTHDLYTCGVSELVHLDVCFSYFDGRISSRDATKLRDEDQQASHPAR